MENSAHNDSQYNGDSPAKAATKSFVWSFITDMALFSMIGLIFDRVFGKIPFGKDTWSRIKDDALINGILATGFGLWRANTTFTRVKEENHHAACNRLDVENAILREQLKEAGLKPHEIVSIIPVNADELTSMKRDDQALPTQLTQSDTATELAHTQQALANVSHALEVATNHTASFKAPSDNHAEKLGAPVESHVEQAVIDKAAAEQATATIH